MRYEVISSASDYNEAYEDCEDRNGTLLTLDLQMNWLLVPSQELSSGNHLIHMRLIYISLHAFIIWNST